MKQLIVFALLVVTTASVQALSFSLPEDGSDVVGEVFTVRTRNYDDTLHLYAEAYGIGFREIVAANPTVNPWVPGEDTEVLLPVEFILPPGPREGIVINLAELRMYYYLPDGKTLLTYPLGIGREGWETPIVEARVTGVIAKPTWVPPPSIHAEHRAMGDPLPSVVPPGPDNPLGEWAVGLSAKGYFIHGTNKDIGVGMRVSHGCMRMYNGDVEEFAKRVKKNTPVRIINEPVKTGWVNGELFVEVHEALEEQRSSFVAEQAVARAISKAKGESVDIEIDWNTAKLAASSLNGMPTRVSIQKVAQR